MTQCCISLNWFSTANCHHCSILSSLSTASTHKNWHYGRKKTWITLICSSHKRMTFLCVWSQLTRQTEVTFCGKMPHSDKSTLSWLRSNKVLKVRQSTLMSWYLLFTGNSIKDWWMSFQDKKVWDTIMVRHWFTNRKTVTMWLTCKRLRFKLSHHWSLGWSCWCLSRRINKTKRRMLEMTMKECCWLWMNS